VQQAARTGASHGTHRLGKTTSLAAMMTRSTPSGTNTSSPSKTPSSICTAQEVSHQPTRGRRRHGILQEGTQVHPAARPRRGPHRRDARSGNHRGRVGDGGNRHLCFATLHTNSAVQTINASSTCFPESAVAGSRATLLRAGGHHLSGAAPAATGQDASRPWK